MPTFYHETGAPRLMRFTWIAVAAVCALLPAAASALEIEVTPDQNGVYHAGEKAAWSVTIMEDGAPYDGPVAYTLKSGGWTVLEEATVRASNGLCRIVAPEKDTCGSLLLEVTRGESRGLGGAVFDGHDIQPSASEPHDFDAFWKGKIAELETIPYDVMLEKVDVAEEVDYWKITLRGYGGSTIHGQIAKPKNADNTLPIHLQLQWAGVYPLEQAWVIDPAREGWLAMNIIAHDLPIDREKEFYEQQSGGGLKGYETLGNEDREKSYFLRMYLSCYRAVEYLTQREDWDGKVLHVRGTSQGGLQSIMVAGLHPAVSSVAANVPAGCDLAGEQVGRDAGWPKWGRWQDEEKKAQRLEAAGYFDVVNFARRVKCPTLVGVGLIDEICPPEGVFAMYNQLAGGKRLVILSIAGHSEVDGSFGPFYTTEYEWGVAVKEGRPAPTEPGSAQ